MGSSHLVTDVVSLKGINNLGIPRSKAEVRVERQKLQEGRLLRASGKAVSGGTQALKGSKPHKGVVRPRRPEIDTLKERRPRELQSRSAGETAGRLRRFKSGSKLQGRPKPQTEPAAAGRSGAGEMRSYGETPIRRGRGKPEFAGR